MTALNASMHPDQQLAQRIVQLEHDNQQLHKAVRLLNGPDNPLPDLEWPGTDKPASWWGRDSLGQITKVYRD